MWRSYRGHRGHTEVTDGARILKTRLSHTVNQNTKCRVDVLSMPANVSDIRPALNRLLPSYSAVIMTKIDHVL